MALKQLADHFFTAPPMSGPGCEPYPAGRHGPTRFYARDQILFRQGDAAANWLRVRSGCVRVAKCSDDGRRQILAFAFSGEILGLDALTTHPTTAETVVASEIERLDRRDWERHAASDAALARQLRGHAAGAIRRLVNHLLLLARGSAVQRVAQFIREMAERGEPDRIVLPMSRSDIADYLGLSCETLSRTLAELKRTGIIDVPETQLIHVRDPIALDSIR